MPCDVYKILNFRGRLIDLAVALHGEVTELMENLIASGFKLELAYTASDQEAAIERAASLINQCQTDF